MGLDDCAVTYGDNVQELLPGNYAPTPTHTFLTLLHRKGLLHRCFTQNIDSLEVSAGLPKDVVVAAHGNFDTASCIDCCEPAAVSEVFDCISREEVRAVRGACTCPACWPEQFKSVLMSPTRRYLLLADIQMQALQRLGQARCERLLLNAFCPHFLITLQTRFP